MRKTLKIFHTLSAAGIIGGLAIYILLLVYAPQDTAQAYADLRRSISLISDYVLLPSLGIALFTGLVAMAIHHPFLDMGWAWLKTAMGLLMFKGVLTIIGAKAASIEAISQRIAAGEPEPAVLADALAGEWGTLWVILALSVANVVLGIWRPKLSREGARRGRAEPSTRQTSG